MHPLFTRRHLLQSASLVAGALLAPGLAAAAPMLGLQGRPGLLVPESPAGDSFIAGVRLALPATALKVERAEVGRLAMAEGVQRLVQAGQNRLVGLMGPNVAAAAAPHLAGATLLAVDTGANLIRTDEESAGVLTHSLGLWRGALALGAWSVQQYGSQGLVLSSVHESGYDMLHAFEIGLTQAGGTALPAIITHAPTATLDWPSVIEQVRAAKPDVVYALYSGAEAVEFLRVWRASGLRIPLVASPFLVEERLLPQHQGRAEGLVSSASWAPGLANSANEQFVAAFGEAADAFALLGYEAGLLLAADLQAVEGPRGWIRPGALGATRSPLYLRQVVGLTNRVMGALPAPAENDPAVAQVRNAVRTGWTNPYRV